MNALKNRAARWMCALLITGTVATATSTAAAGPSRDRGYVNTGAYHIHDAGVLYIGTHGKTIGSRGDIKQKLVRNFRRAGYDAWVQHGEVRARIGYRGPRISWTPAEYGLQIRYSGDCVILKPYLYDRSYAKPAYKKTYRPASRVYDPGFSAAITFGKGWRRPYRPNTGYGYSQCPW